jgi:hypothetical protein
MRRGVLNDAEIGFDSIIRKHHPGGGLTALGRRLTVERCNVRVRISTACWVIWESA